MKFLSKEEGGFSKQAVFDGATGKFSICPYFMEAGKLGELILVKEFRGLQIQFSFAGSCMKLGKSLFLSWSNSQGLISSLSSCVPIAKIMRIFGTKLSLESHKCSEWEKNGINARACCGSKMQNIKSAFLMTQYK